MNRRIEYLRLEETIRRRAGGKPVYFITNPGNWGDALIKFGTITFLNFIGVEYRILSPGDSLANRIRNNLAYRSDRLCLFSGGGAWGNNWRHSMDAVTALSERRAFSHVVVLPSTFEFPVSLENTTLFCRDRYQSQAHNPHASFCHDMAFFIGNLISGEGEGTGHFFRQDVERNAVNRVPEDNLDLSARGTDEDGVFEFLETISRVRTVHTDRLHVAIGASLLGKELHMYPGNNFKNRSVYDSSIAPYFPNTFFHERFE